MIHSSSYLDLFVSVTFEIQMIDSKSMLITFLSKIKCPNKETIITLSNFNYEKRLQCYRVRMDLQNMETFI